MTGKADENSWEDTGWEGSRRAQLRRSLALTLRERLEALEQLAETDRWLQELRAQGRFHYDREQPEAEERVSEPTREYKLAGDRRGPGKDPA